MSEVLSFDEVKQKMLAPYLPHTQKWNEAQVSLAGLKAALDDIARHGMPLGLVESAKIIGPQFPQGVYHQVHGYMTVNSEDELKAAEKDGWRVRGPEVVAA